MRLFGKVNTNKNIKLSELQQQQQTKQQAPIKKAPVQIGRKRCCGGK